MRVVRSSRRVAAVLGAAALLAAACGSGGSGDTDTQASEPTEESEPTEDSEPTEEPEEGSEEEGAAPDDDGEVMSSITIGMNNPNYATQLPTVLADEWGYFADEGIEEIEIINTDDYIPALIGGSLHITQGDTDVAFGSAEASGIDIVWLGTYRNSEYRILAGAEGIDEPEDLVGGTVVTGAEGGRTYLATVSAVEALGLDPADVQFVTTGGASDTWAQQLISGQVQGSAIFPRHIPLIEEAGGTILYNESFEVPQEGLMVLESFLEENRATVEAFLRATLRARQDLQDTSRKDEVLQIMRDRGFEIPEVFEQTYEFELTQISPDGGFDPAVMDEFVQEVIDMENLPQDIDWRQYVDIGPLNAAQEAVGIEPNPTSLE